jgi:hypothetical protein
VDDDLAAVVSHPGGVGPQDDGKTAWVHGDALQSEEVVAIDGGGHDLHEFPALRGPRFVSLYDGEAGQRVGGIGSDCEDGEHVPAILGSS